MTKFKVGDRVRDANTIGTEGTITYVVWDDLSIAPYYDVMFDNGWFIHASPGNTLELVSSVPDPDEELGEPVAVKWFFKIGDRVEYTGNFTPEFKGKTGTVVAHDSTDDVRVRWDGDAVGWSGVLPRNLTKVIRKPLFTDVSPREELLLGAVEAVTKQRNNSYGPPTQDFDRTAKMLTALGFRFILPNGHKGSVATGKIEPHHVAMIQIVAKLSRATWSPQHKDHWLDIAGYSGCGWECVQVQEEVSD